MLSRLHLAYLYIFFLLACAPSPNRFEAKSNENATPFASPPQWAKTAVWYQIFVERFRNGDSSNDPRPEDIMGAYPNFVPKGWSLTPWTHDWYKEDAYLKNVAEVENAPFKLEAFGQKSQLRRYGGDLQGVLDQMDYLDSLGINAIYFNPLNDAPSLHKFDARYWRHIDRNFGPNPTKDVQTMQNEVDDDPSTWQFTEADQLFLKVIKEAHKRGIRVIVDFSWNHTGSEFWAWKEVLKNQKKSKYSDWYWIKEFDNPLTQENEFKYQGWAGVPSLPEIKETAYHDLSQGVKIIDGNIYSEAAKTHIFNVTQRWLDPNADGDPSDGIDGFRLDVAAEMPLGFWQEFRQKVRSINPDAYLVGEVWWEKWPDKLLDPAPFLDGKIFDAVMNYRWYKASRHFFNAAPDTLTVKAFIDSLTFQYSSIKKANNYAMMNLVSSHDVPRVLTSLYNKNKYKYQSKPEDNPTYKINKPDEDTYQTLRLLLAHQFTYVGSPHIWAGDEMGMWGADDPSNRKPLIWPDYQFEDEIAHPLQMQRPIDKVSFDYQLFAYYQKLITLRKSNPVLIHGELSFMPAAKSNGLFAYRRFDDQNEIIVVFNHHHQSSNFELSRDTGHLYQDILNGIKSQNPVDGKTLWEIAPRNALILKKINPQE